MAPRDPRDVLGVPPGATPDEIKAAWRQLARRNHPDLTGDDPEAAARATRRMAEINRAYEALTRPGPRAGRARAGAPEAAPPGRPRPRREAGGPPPPPRTRPVTGRLDTSGTVRPRNQVTTPPGTPLPLEGFPPPRPDRVPPDLRASTPSGPLERDRVPADRLPPAPGLGEALEVELDFGRFHGHTLGQVAAFEPSYIDWLATTATRDPAVTSAARVVRAELDRRGVRRVARPARPGWRSNPFL